MKSIRIIFIAICMVLLSSCYTTRYVDHYVSVVDDLMSQYEGTTKSYIIEHYPYPPTDNKELGDGYEILTFKRWRNGVVGYGITDFYLRNGKCYSIKTNEYKNVPRLEKVSVF